MAPSLSGGPSTASRACPPLSATETGSQRRLVAAIFVLGLVAVVVHELILTEVLRPEDLVRLRHGIKDFGPWAPATFIMAYVVGMVVFVPPIPLTILGGLAFGPTWGTVYSVIGSAVGGCLSFLIARYAARNAVERWMVPYPALGRLDRAVARHGFRTVMVTRLVPMFPFHLQNYAYGLTSIGLGAYALTSWLCMLPATIALTASAGAVFTAVWNVRRMLLLLAVAGVLLLALVLLPRWLRGHSGALVELLRSE